MAAGVKKLTIGGEHTAEQAVHYLADPQARGDYCSEGGAALMFWLATPRSQTYFGLGELVSRAKLTALLNGQHPVDGQLIRRPGPDGTMVGGIDVTVSPAPKSVSALWALADDELRRELEELVILAAHRAVGRMLAEVLLLRERYGPGPRDVRHVTATDWVGVEVLHTTARLSERKGVPDPQLHVHNVLIGALDYAGELGLQHRELVPAPDQREGPGACRSSSSALRCSRGFLTSQERLAPIGSLPLPPGPVSAGRRAMSIPAPRAWSRMLRNRGRPAHEPLGWPPRWPRRGLPGRSLPQSLRSGRDAGSQPVRVYL